MSLLIAALIGLLLTALRREPNGRLWRLLVEAPARRLNTITWRHVAIVMLAVIFMDLFATLAMPHMAVVLAVDIVAWIDVFAATLIVTRLAPGWRAMKVLLGRAAAGLVQPRPRTPRAPRARRPMSKPSDDPDPAGSLAFA
jgi:hypothetical protein